MSTQRSLSATLAGAAHACPGLVEILVADPRGTVLEHWRRGAPAAGGPEPAATARAAMDAIPALGRVAAATRVGRPAEWILAAEKGSVVVRRIGRHELFLVLRVLPEEWLGRARFAARTLAARLESAL